MPGGRPTKMTKEVLDKLERAFSYGMSNEEACLEADIGMSTLYDYYSENPDFKKRRDLLVNRPLAIARKCVVDKLPESSELSFKYLERKKKDEFAVKTEVTTTGTIVLNFDEKDKNA